MARLLPADLAAFGAGIKTSTLRDWRRRGLITPAGGTERHPLYNPADILAAKNAAKPRRNTRLAA